MKQGSVTDKELIYINLRILIWNNGLNIVNDLVNQVKLLYNYVGLLELPVWI